MGIYLCMRFIKVTTQRHSRPRRKSPLSMLAQSHQLYLLQHTFSNIIMENFVVGLALCIVLRFGVTSIGIDSGGAARARTPPIIRMGAKPLFCPPIIRREFFNFVYLKK